MCYRNLQEAGIKVPSSGVKVTKPLEPVTVNKDVMCC